MNTDANGPAGRSRFSRWAPLTALVLASVWIYRDVLFGGAAFLGLDASLQQEALAFFRRHLLRGEFPTWNPHVMCGGPVFGDAHSQLLYPPNIVLLFFSDTPRAWSFLSMVHLLVGGGGTYLFGREIGYSKTAAIASGLAFMLCEFTLSVIDEPVALHSVVWLPLVLWCTHRAFSGRKAYVLWAGIVTGVMLLSTMFQYAFCVLLLTAAYGAFAAATGDGRPTTGEQGTNRHRVLRWVRVQGAILAIGTGLFAVQLLPLLEAKGLSARALLDLEAALGPPAESLSGWDILNMVLPWLADGKKGFASHVGFLTVLLAALSFARKPRRVAWFFAGTGAFFLLLGLGRHTPVYGLAHSLGIPGFSLFKDPNRMSYPLFFCLAILAGGGVVVVEKWTSGLGRFAARAVPAAAATLIGLNLLWLAPAHRALMDPGSRAELTSPDAAVRAVFEDGARGRVFSTLPPLNLSRPSLFGLFGADDWNTFAPLRYLQFTAGTAKVDPKSHTASKSILGSPNRARLAMLRHAYLAPAEAISLRLAPAFEPFATTARGTLYRDAGSLPRAFVAPRAASIVDTDRRIERLDDPGFDPLREVILQTKEPAGPGGGEGTAGILASRPDRIEILAETSGESWLVLLDSFHPGWRATVDGAPAEILVADHAFRAVRLSAGRHRVVFTFRAALLYGGGAISLIAVVAIVGGFLACRGRKPAA